LGQIGCAGYLIKPIRQSQLLEATIAVMERKDFHKKAKTSQLVTQHTLSELKRKNYQLLLAEDNPINQKLAVTILQKSGYSIDVVDDGEQAVKAIEGGTYNLVLMDVQMPGLDGFEATQRIRSSDGEYQHVPIIAMTAHAMSGDRERCLAAGMDDYISKPFDLDELLHTVEKWLVKEPLHADELETQRKVVAVPQMDEPVNIELALPRFSDDKNFFIELLTEFTDHLNDRLKEMHRTADSANLGDLVRQAHNLKGSASNFNAEPLTSLAQDIELQARMGNTTSLSSNLSKIANEEPRLREFLSKIIKS
jgi:CheY-like chemotaxis protein